MLYLIANAGSGKGRGRRLLKQIETVLREKKETYRLLLTTHAGHAEELAGFASGENDCEGIVAVGGDGTFSEVLNGMDLRVPLGLVPAGSGNDYVRAVHIRGSVRDMLKPILERKITPVDYILVNGRRCLNILGTGFDVDLLKWEHKFRSVLSGSSSYFLALLITLLHFSFRRFHIKVDGKEIDETAFVMAVCNGQYYGGGLPISPASQVDDGVLELVVIREFPRWKVFYMLLKFLKGKLAELKNCVDIYPCHQVDCVIDPFVEMQIEGELYNMNPFSAEICPGGLKLFLSK